MNAAPIATNKDVGVPNELAPATTGVEGEGRGELVEPPEPLVGEVPPGARVVGELPPPGVAVEPPPGAPPPGAALPSASFL